MLRKSCQRCCQMNKMNSAHMMEDESSNCLAENEMFDTSCNECSCNMCTKNCNCGFDEPCNMFPLNPRLGQSYVPTQMMPDKVFKPCVGLGMGSIFPELFSPYMPCQSIEENKYLAQTNEPKGGCNTCM